MQLSGSKETLDELAEVGTLAVMQLYLVVIAAARKKNRSYRINLLSVSLSQP